MSQLKEGFFVGYIKNKGARSFGGKVRIYTTKKYIETTGMDELADRKVQSTQIWKKTSGGAIILSPPVTHND